jgi:hypothetical protein
MDQLFKNKIILKNEILFYRVTKLKLVLEHNYKQEHRVHNIFYKKKPKFEQEKNEFRCTYELLLTIYSTIL